MIQFITNRLPRLTLRFDTIPVYMDCMVVTASSNFIDEPHQLQQ